LGVEFLKNKFTEQVGKRIEEERAQTAYTAFAGVSNVTDIALLARLYKA
jgi:aconitate decarboxylase